MDSSPRLTYFVKPALGHRDPISPTPSRRPGMSSTYLQLIVRGPVPLFYFSSVTFARLHLIQSFITPLLPVFSCFVLRSLFTFQDITPVHSLPVQEQHNFRSLWIHTAGSGRSTRRALVVYPLVQFGASQETALYI